MLEVITNTELEISFSGGSVMIALTGEDYGKIIRINHFLDLKSAKEICEKILQRIERYENGN